MTNSLPVLLVFFVVCVAFAVLFSENSITLTKKKLRLLFAQLIGLTAILVLAYLLKNSFDTQELTDYFKVVASLLGLAKLFRWAMIPSKEAKTEGSNQSDE